MKYRGCNDFAEKWRKDMVGAFFDRRPILAGEEIYEENGLFIADYGIVVTGAKAPGNCHVEVAGEVAILIGVSGEAARWNGEILSVFDVDRYNLVGHFYDNIATVSRYSKYRKCLPRTFMDGYRLKHSGVVHKYPLMIRKKKPVEILVDKTRYFDELLNDYNGQYWEDAVLKEMKLLGIKMSEDIEHKLALKRMKRELGGGS